MNHIDYSLPSFVFLDGKTNEGDTLQDRTVVLHVRSHSVIECVNMQHVFASEFKSKAKTYRVASDSGKDNIYLLALHYSVGASDNETIESILDEAWMFYSFNKIKKANE